MTMTERVARDIAMANGCAAGDFATYLPHARAAIAAMREPTEAMFPRDSVGRLHMPSLRIWQEMIDAALSEKD